MTASIRNLSIARNLRQLDEDAFIVTWALAQVQGASEEDLREFKLEAEIRVREKLDPNILRKIYKAESVALTKAEVIFEYGDGNP